MDFTLIGIIKFVAALYFLGFTVKFLLMVTGAPVATAVYYRLSQRDGADPKMPMLFALMVASSILMALVGWTQALYRERFSFFRMYTRRETMRDVVTSYRNMHLQSIAN